MKVTKWIVETVEAAGLRALAKFVGETSSILNNGIHLADQLAGDVKEIRFTTGTSVNVLTKSKGRPVAVWCLRARTARTGDPGVYMSGNFVTWYFNDGKVTITAVDGLTAATDYAITIAIVEG